MSKVSSLKILQKSKLVLQFNLQRNVSSFLKVLPTVTAREIVLLDLAIGNNCELSENCNNYVLSLQGLPLYNLLSNSQRSQNKQLPLTQLRLDLSLKTIEQRERLFQSTHQSQTMTFFQLMLFLGFYFPSLFIPFSLTAFGSCHLKSLLL